MPKISKTTASMNFKFPGFMESHEDFIGGWNVSIMTCSTDLDQAPLFKGGPDDMCPATHLGYVLKGKFGVRRADGTEETYEAGEAFVIEPGHIPVNYVDSEYVAFTPTEDAQRQTAIMMPNLEKFAASHGMELPEQMRQMLPSSNP
ncbi:hypothetical protein [Sinomonas atrocyanea]